jgi:MoaA/NifB/PqqE/SkfB family radical SAM enzyme
MSSRSRERLDKILFYLGSRKLLRFATLHPDWADVRVTESCNSRCTTCYAWKNKPENELTTEEMKDALRQLKEVGVKHVVFIGGEPLLRKDIGEIINESARLGFETRIIVTNGLLLKDKAKELLSNGITHITVSIDGIGESDDKIRGIPGSYARAVEGIKAVQKLKKAMGLDVPVTIITTMLLNQNVEDISKLIELAKSLDAYWLFNLLDPNLNIFKGIPFSELIVQDKEKIDDTINYLKKTCQQDPQLISTCDHMLEFARNYLKGDNRYDFHCVHGYRAIYLGSHGEVYLGCYALEPIGNIRKNKLREIVGSKKHRERAEQMYVMECPGCTNRYEFNIATKHLISHQIYCERKRKKQASASA